jgi:hypothetical protein
MTNYQQLLHDLEHLFILARNHEFHDFRNTQFIAPKVELIKRLNAISFRAKAGEYDQDDEARG